MADNNSEFGFWDKIKYIFSDPNLFFEKVKTEKGIKNSLLTYVILGTFFSVVSYGFSMAMTGLMSGGYGLFSGFNLLSAGALFYFLGAGIIMTFVYSALIHVIIIAFKGEGAYSGSYNVYTYSMIPYLILNVVPMVGFAAIIYSAILMIIGISKIHNLSKGKSALAVLLPFFLIVGLLIIFSIILLHYIASGTEVLIT